jgi:hypothetical protein
LQAHHGRRKATQDFPLALSHPGEALLRREIFLAGADNQSQI